MKSVHVSAPKFEKLADEFKDALFLKVDVDELVSFIPYSMLKSRNCNFRRFK